MNDTPKFYDNTRVKSGRGSNEYLAISLAPEEEYMPYRVSLARYCVPGRCDTYVFYWYASPCRGIGDRVAYYTEGWTLSLGKALKLLEDDLEKPQVVQMILNAFENEILAIRYAREFIHLVQSVAPKSSILRKVKRLYQKHLANRTKRFDKANESVTA